MLMKDLQLRPGLHDIGSLFMPDRFHESDTENAPSVGVYTKSYTEFRSRAYRIHTEPCEENANLI